MRGGGGGGGYGGGHGYGGSARGRGGRGGRGGYGGNGGGGGSRLDSQRGPRLPRALLDGLPAQDVDGRAPRPTSRGSDSGAGGHSGGRGAPPRGSRKERRRAERDAKKQAHVEHFESRHQAKQRAAQAIEQGSGKRAAAELVQPESKRPRSDVKPAAKPMHSAAGARGRAPHMHVPGATKTRFEELLGNDGRAGRTALSREAFEADLKQQRRMERKLGLKKDAKLKDDLGALLEGITVANELMPIYSEGRRVRKGVAATGSVGGARQEAAARAVSDSASGDDSDSLGGSDASEMSDDDADADSGSSSDGGVGMAGLMEDNSDGGGDEYAGTDNDEEDSSDGEDATMDGSDEGEAEERSEDGLEDGSADSGLYTSESDEREDDDDNDVEDRQAGDAAKPRADGGDAGGAGGKYVPPAVRARLAAEAAGGGTGTGASTGVTRRITGLVNRLAEANMQGIVKDVAGLYATEGRRAVISVVTEQILSAASEGPRATEQFAATAAAFIAACAGTCSSSELAATFLSGVAERLQLAYKQKDSLAMGNLVRVLAHTYAVSLVRSEVLYSFLEAAKARLTEADIDMIVALLGSVGMQLRNEDPAAMKEFVLGVHSRAAELGAQGALTQRARMMLDLVVDIKNNRKDRAAAAGGRRAAAVLSPTLLKWLKGTGVEEVQLRNVSWDKLIDKSRQKGMWWLPAAGEALPKLPGLAGAAGGTINSSGSPDEETAALLRLAAQHRMNTDARRAVFVAIMGSEDCVEAHEKLLRLPLRGEQEREVVRVLLHCCLAESTWNPYYGLLAMKLAKSAKGHRMTMQFVLWDAFKALSKKEHSTAQLVSLARLAALCIAHHALPLAMLKVVDFSELDARSVFFWRLFFRYLLSSCKDGGDLQEVFLRLTAQRKVLGALVAAMLKFVRSNVGPWLASQEAGGAGAGSSAATGGALTQAQLDELLRRVRIAERVLSGGR